MDKNLVDLVIRVVLVGKFQYCLWLLGFKYFFENKIFFEKFEFQNLDDDKEIWFEIICVKLVVLKDFLFGM